ncbi:MAG: hypothetical protein V3S24_11845, partial [Candidatus Tectomicrobia bacterium]
PRDGKVIYDTILRHDFISDNPDDPEDFEEQLENAGVSTPQICVLSRSDVFETTIRGGSDTKNRFGLRYL